MAITAIAAYISVIIGRVNRSLKFYAFSLKKCCQNISDFDAETLTNPAQLHMLSFVYFDFKQNFVLGRQLIKKSPHDFQA